MLIQLNSIDGHSFVISKEICGISQHIQNTLNISVPDEEMPIIDLVQLNGANLEIIVNFMKEYHQNPFATLTRETIYDTIPEYYRNLLETTKLISDNGDLNDVSLMNLMVFASNLQIDCLSSLIAYNIAHLIRDKSHKQRFALFNIPEDHVVNQEDVDKLRDEYSYAFENTNEVDNNGDSDSDSSDV